MHRCNGFTLVETVVSLLVLAVLLMVAVPAWSNVLARTHAASARAALLVSITRAIGHAARAGTEVVLCPATAAACTDTWDWSGGWIAYADRDGDRLRDPGEKLVDQHPALADDVRLLTSKGRKRLVFQPNGGNAGSNVTFTLCVGAGQSAKTLVLANNGNLRSAPLAQQSQTKCKASGADSL